MHTVGVLSGLLDISDGLRSRIAGLLNEGRDRVVASTSALFSHGPTPLEHTLSYRGDPGLLGPDSVSWPVIGDVAAFVGGIRGLLVQTAHPEVVAGVDDHSRYRKDPLGRLSATSYYVTETTYGAVPEVERAVQLVRAAHRPVRGLSERGKPYSAAHPELAAWVHNALTESFLTAYEFYGARPLSSEEADRFVCEQARIGALLDADPLPDTAAALRAWLCEHPEIAPSAAQQRAVDFLRDPPLAAPVKAGYKLLLTAAVATLPPALGEIIGIDPTRGGERIGRAATSALRWALGSSPSWHLSLVRAGAEVPDGVFRQRLRSSAGEAQPTGETSAATSNCS